MLVSLSFQRMNRLREERYLQAKQKGYSFLNYVSSRAVTWPDLSLGENCLISEQTIVHPFVKIGSNVIVGANATIGHHSVIGDNVFIAPGAVILGGVHIESHSVIGANASVKEGVRIGRECLIGMGVSVYQNTSARQALVRRPPELLPKPSNELDRWLSWVAH
jgi:sugar O-acyltransferase (sialic acid O-acetyltransferase NeuD family)